jgi:hypothetical protein
MASPAPACRKGLNDATARWPNRSKISDGIMGDAAHQKRKSDHNQGNAFDVTHDPRVGCDGDVIAAIALRDPRTKMVIWNRRKWDFERGDKGWKPYKGENPHTKHCHVSIWDRSRNDKRPWGWAPGGSVAVPPPPVAGDTGAPPPPARRTREPTATTLRDSRTQILLPAENGPFPGIAVKRGDRSEVVRRVQARLRRLGWEVGVDGIFGPVTEKWVRAFQRRKDLDDDGIVGRRTWKALFS